MMRGELTGLGLLLLMAACGEDTLQRSGDGAATDSGTTADGSSESDGGSDTETATDTGSEGSADAGGDTTEGSADTTADTTLEDTSADTDLADTTDDTAVSDTTDDTVADTTADTTADTAADTDLDLDGLDDTDPNATGCTGGADPLPADLPYIWGGDTCETAALLPGAGTYGADTCTATNDYADYAGACGPYVTGAGRDAVYALEVPGRSAATVSISPGARFDAARLMLSDDCANIRTDCDAYAGDAVSYNNPSDTAKTVYVVVEGFIARSEGSYLLSVVLNDLSALPEGHTCANAIRLDGAGSYTGDTTTSENYYDGLHGTCLRFGSFPSAQSGRDLTYVVSVPNGSTLSVTMNGTSPVGWDTAVAIFDDCGNADTSCRSYADDGAATVTNSSGAARDYFIVADGFFNYTVGAYTLNVNITP